MLTRSVLSTIKEPELRKALHLDDDAKDAESGISWIEDNINKIRRAARQEHPPQSLQQSDLLRDFYLSIAKDGLKYAYEHTSLKPGELPRPSFLPRGPGGHDKRNRVIIVGAGMSGMAAAYELKNVGYDVEILEMSQRFGGRVKTLGRKDGFDKGQHTDAGAMRLPLPPQKERPVSQMIHYLTDYYAMKKFDLTPVPFSNYSDKAFYNFYGESTRISDWKDSQFSHYWPGWDSKIIKTKQTGKIKNIGDYYDATVDVVISLLKKRLASIPDPNDVRAQAVQWDLWTNNWCQFSFGSFLRSTLDAIKSLLVFDDIIKPDDPILAELKKYLRWPEAAITAYTTFTYTLSPDVSLVNVIQDKMGAWWSDKMHSLEGGLSALPDAFAFGERGVDEFITYNRSVSQVTYKWVNDKLKSVLVSGVITSSGESFSTEGRSVIITVPLNIVRGIEIVNGYKDLFKTKEECDMLYILKPFPKEFQKAIQDISYSPSTKIMLQYNKQFWNTGEDEDNDITGGFSKTNMPIGQVHYPTEVVVGVGAWGPAPVTPDQKGILMVYTWKAEALLWGAMPEHAAVRLAVEQVDNIHPEINTKKYFEVGKMQAWASDPTSLGAFAMLRPAEYTSVMYLMQNSWRNVYFGGEAISFANGWIQGALESGLRAAYQLYADDQPKK